LKGAKVVTEIAPLSDSEITVHEMGVMIEESIADPITVEQPNQEEWHGVTHRVSLASELAQTKSESLNLAVVRDEFDANTFDENLDNEHHVKENDELAAKVMRKTCNLQLTQLLMHQSAQVVKPMRLMCPPQRLLCVMSQHQVTLMSQHQVTLTGVRITQTKS
jgi:hypothetical protein